MGKNRQVSILSSIFLSLSFIVGMCYVLLNHNWKSNPMWLQWWLSVIIVTPMWLQCDSNDVTPMMWLQCDSNVTPMCHQCDSNVSSMWLQWWLYLKKCPILSGIFLSLSLSLLVCVMFCWIILIITENQTRCDSNDDYLRLLNCVAISVSLNKILFKYTLQGVL